VKPCFALSNLAAKLAAAQVELKAELSATMLTMTCEGSCPHEYTQPWTRQSVTEEDGAFV
jgi:hypothetical protein